MKILFVCHRLTTFILNEVIELQNLKNDMTIYSYRQNRSIYSKTVLPMLRENGLEEKTFIDFSSRRNRIKLFFSTALSLVNDFLRYPVRTWKSFVTLCGIFEQPKNRIKWYIETRNLIGKKFDIIHSPFSTLENIKIVYFLSDIQNIPFTLSFRAHDLHIINDFNQLLKKKELIQQATNVFTISKYNKKILEQKIKTKKTIDIIHGGVDTAFFKPYDIEKQPNSLIAVCRFHQQKGLIYLLQACKILNERNVPYQCHLIGEGPEEETYRDFIKHHSVPNISIVNFLNRKGVREELAKSQLFVLPCVVLEDGTCDILANSLKEAMSMELPIITSDIRGIRELIDNKESGILIPPKNPDELANTIEFLLKDKELMSRMGKNGRKKILNDFNIKKEAVKINQLLTASVASFQKRKRDPFQMVDAKEMKIIQ
jgi:glycosyltransferase involved in cell wall biosynthesis